MYTSWPVNSKKNFRKSDDAATCELLAKGKLPERGCGAAEGWWEGERTPPSQGFPQARHGFRLRLRLIYGPDLPVFDHQAGRGLRTRDAARPPVATAVRIATDSWRSPPSDIQPIAPIAGPRRWFSCSRATWMA